jgi:hypothetical protein
MVTANKRRDRCPKCNTALLSDYGEPYCLAHGTIDPSQVIHITEEDMASKYDNAIPQILEDLKSMNLTECEKKNGIAMQTLGSLLKRWRTEGKIPAGNGGGHLPPWNEAWGDVVKVAWLAAFSGK